MGLNKTKLILGIGITLLAVGVGVTSFFAGRNINKQQSLESSISSGEVEGQQVEGSTPSPSSKTDQVNSSQETFENKNQTSPKPTQTPYPPTPTPTSLLTPTPKPQIDMGLLNYLNDYKAKVEAEIILNSSNLTRYESERQEMINGYLSDGLNPPDWYLETTSRIINNTKSRIETLKGIKAKIEDWISRTKAGETISRSEVDSFVGPLLNQ